MVPGGVADRFRLLFQFVRVGIGLQADSAALILQRIGLRIPRLVDGTIGAIGSLSSLLCRAVAVVGDAGWFGRGLVLCRTGFLLTAIARGKHKRQHGGHDDGCPVDAAPFRQRRGGIRRPSSAQMLSPSAPLTLPFTS